MIKHDGRFDRFGNMVRLVSLFVASALLGVPAVAQTAEAAAETTAEQQSDAHKIVCKREEKIGSRLGAKKVCLTVQEWLERERASKDAAERWQQSAGVTPST